MKQYMYAFFLINLWLLAKDKNLVQSQNFVANQFVDFIGTREANLQCNTASKLKSLTLKSPATINKDLCVYTIKPYSANVCQLLIEFQKFELQQPVFNANSNYLDCSDHLTVGDFTLCGDNTGQHLYLPFNVAKGIKEITLSFSLSNRWPQTNWNLHVTQLECPATKKRSNWPMYPLSDVINFPNLRTIFMQPTNVNDVEKLAPAGCDQYFTQLEGTIKSFNYKENGSGFYLPDMNYVICIKAVMGATMIEYQPQKFSMSTEGLGGFDSDCHSLVHTSGRREDYLMIPQSIVTNNVDVVPTYYCGKSLETIPSIIASPPFVIYFSSDTYTDETETGFNIKYRIRTA